MNVSDRELEAVVQGITDAVLAYVRRELGPLTQKIMALESRLDVIEKSARVPRL